MLPYLLLNILCAGCCTTVAFCWTGKLILSVRGVPSFAAQVLLVDTFVLQNCALLLVGVTFVWIRGGMKSDLCLQ